MAYQLSKAEFLVLLRHSWLQLIKQQLATASPLLYYKYNKWNRSLFDLYIFTSFGLQRRSSFSWICFTNFAFSSFNPCLGRFSFTVIVEITARPSIKWFKFTCVDILEGIFQIYSFFKFTMCLNFSWNSSVEDASFSENIWSFSSFCTSRCFTTL